MFDVSLPIQRIKFGIALAIVGIGAIASALWLPVFFIFIPISILLAVGVVSLDYAWFKFIRPKTTAWRVLQQTDKWEPHHFHLWAVICVLFFVWAWLNLSFGGGALHIYLLEYVNSSLILPAVLVAWAGLFLLVAFQTRRFSLLILIICTAGVVLGSQIAFDAPSHLASTHFGGKIYHVAISIDDRNWGTYILYKCDTTGIMCRGHEIYETGWPTSATLLIEGNKLQVNLKPERASPEGQETIYTLDVTGNQWCKNDYFCRALLYP